MGSKSEEYLTVKEFAERFRLDKRHVYRLIHDGKIPHYEIYGTIRVRPKDFRVGYKELNL